MRSATAAVDRARVSVPALLRGCEDGRDGPGMLQATCNGGHGDGCLGDGPEEKAPAGSRLLDVRRLGWRIMGDGLAMKCRQPLQQQWRVGGSHRARRAGRAGIARGAGEDMDTQRDGVFEPGAERGRLLDEAARRLAGAGDTGIIDLALSPVRARGIPSHRDCRAEWPVPAAGRRNGPPLPRSNGESPPAFPLPTRLRRSAH